MQIAEKLLPLITKPKRIKIAVGGRGGSKSIAFADAFLKFCSDGERLCCAREFQNSIDDSVHSLMKSRIDELGVVDVTASASAITSQKGGEIFYRGLARNPLSIKSMFGVKKIWVEEAQGLSDATLDLLEPTIREGDSELWFSLNRGSRRDPFAKRMLAKYESQVERHGFYEGDDMIIVQINYTDNPFFPDVLEKTRRKDYENLSRAKYNHIWLGHYADTVDDAIIEPEWFDACVDAHKKLDFEAVGAEICSYDPADCGDAKAFAYMHGVVVKEAVDTEDGDVDTATEWAMRKVAKVKPDAFTWDNDGIGAGLKNQVNRHLEGKKTSIIAFKGSTAARNPESSYGEGDADEQKTNKEMFFNRRAQCYWILRDRMFKTWQAVEKNRYISPDELISFDSEGCNIEQLRAELCRIPRRRNGSGRVQLMTKQEMKKMGIDSPNLGDAVMMLMDCPVDQEEEFSLDLPTSNWMCA